jgi:hypothetical protein
MPLAGATARGDREHADTAKQKVENPINFRLLREICGGRMRLLAMSMM